MKILKKLSKLLFLIPLLWVIIYLIPLYVWPFRAIFSLLYYPLFIILIIVYLSQLLYAVATKRFSRVIFPILGLLFAAAIFFNAGLIYKLRVQTTGKIIQTCYCEGGKATQDYVLGSIKRQGYFYEDSTDCLSSVCEQERYYCQ